ncbi:MULTISPECIES: spore-associated protein [unclassified Streptomyces]|uniref:spore-associated protein n=1 Tax=unclassified Streptomyces TaxID=2593676 RepID=UPI003814B2E1
MGITRRVATAGAITALVLGAASAFGPAAFAAPNVTPQDVCGSAYRTVNSAPIGVVGTVYLTYNSSNGRNCVATIRTNPGTATYMSTYIYVPATGDSAGDSGTYASYAGPASAYGKGYCVSWGGSIDNAYVSVENSNCAALKEHRVSGTR